MRLHTVGLVMILAFARSLGVAPLAVEAQPRGHISVVGVLIPGDPSLDSDPFKSAFSAFRQGLHELGYVEGQTIR